MNRAAFVVTSCLLTAGKGQLARAQPAGREPSPTTVTVAPPSGWSLDAGRTAGQAKALRREARLGGEARVTAAYYVSSPPGGVLIVSELVAEPVPADAVGVARAELASVRAVVDAVGGTLGSWRFQGGAPLLPEARLEWSDASLGTTSITRALAFRTRELLTVVTGECVIAADAAALRAPCEAALAALTPVAALQRVDVGLGADDPAAAPPAPVGEAKPAAEVPPAPEPDQPARPAPSMREGGADLPATILVRPPPAKKDMRPIWLVAGIAVLAAVFVWNRRQRQRLEAAEERERRRGDGRRERRPKDRDADADDARDGDRGPDEDAAAAPTGKPRGDGEDA